ncbi:MAG: BREX-1 system adenine-specific DNA-methyltransferase PglX, partial [Anaerolineae bacterium]|nr:BREX-1 system adenine-specific DNA-methyltransferase PglX [Anaerolineae bacterium]
VIPQDIERYLCNDDIQINESTLTPTKVNSLYRHPKIWIIRIQKMRWKQRIVCAFDGRNNSAGMKTLQVIISTTDDINSLKYLSAILSSKLINFWCVNYLADDMNQSYLSRIPIPTINFSDPADKARHDEMVSLVERMLELTPLLSPQVGGRKSARTPQDKERVAREIESTDEAIDRLVYELYGLTEEEVKIVEGA